MGDYRTRNKIVTLCMTLALFALYVGFGHLAVYGVIEKNPDFARLMTGVTMIYVLGGCVLQTLGYYRVSVIIGTITFLLLCVGLYYSTVWYEFVTFIVCLKIVLGRMAKPCVSSRIQEDDEDDDSEDDELE